MEKKIAKGWIEKDKGRYYVEIPKKDRTGKNKKQKRARLIMQKYLDRKLSNYEVVHHKDGNPLNDDINNLQVMTQEEHSSLHNAGIKKNFIPSNKTPNHKILIIKELYSLGLKISTISKIVNISQSTVRHYLFSQIYIKN